VLFTRFASLRRAIVVALALSAVCALAACAQPPVATLPRVAAPVATPLGKVLVLQVRVIEVAGAKATVDISCMNSAASTVTLTSSQALCRLTALRTADQSVAATMDVPLRHEVLTGAGGGTGSSSDSSLTAAPGDTFGSIADLALPGAGAYSIRAELIGIPGATSAADAAVVR
jgi:hypothetical protein